MSGGRARRRLAHLFPLLVAAALAARATAATRDPVGGGSILDEEVCVSSPAAPNSPTQNTDTLTGREQEPQLSVCVSRETGRVASLRLDPGGGRPAITRSFNTSLTVTGCVLQGAPEVSAAPSGGSITVTQRWRGCDGSNGTAAQGVDVTQRLTAFSVPANPRAPPGEDVSRRAAVKIEAVLMPKGDGEWAAPMVTTFGWDGGALGRGLDVWAAMGQPQVSADFDPLAPWPEAQTPPESVLGGADYMAPATDERERRPDAARGERVEAGDGSGIWARGGLAIPMFTWLNRTGGWGLSLALSPEDVTVYNVLTTPGGGAPPPPPLPPPAGFAPHAPGYWAGGATVGNNVSTTADECASMCRANPACSAFEVYPGATPRYCWVFTGTLRGFVSNNECVTFVKTNLPVPPPPPPPPRPPAPDLYAFTRTGLRFTPGVNVTLTTLLVLHEADWRPALGAMRDAFPEHFYANETVNTSLYDGLMAYADYRGDEASGGPTGNTSIPFFTLKKIGMRVNWDASFPFQGGGYWLGPGTSSWTTCYPHPDNPVRSMGPPACRRASYEGVEATYAEIRDGAGVSTLSYGNLFMWGALIQPLDSPVNFTKACTPLPTDDWQRNNCTLNLLFRREFADAALFDPATNKQIIYSTQYGLAVVDPGTPVYRDLMVQQHKKQVEKTPAMVGVAFDEQQFLGRVNVRRDDGVGWWRGRPAASVFRSFVDVTAAVANEALHPAGRALLVNPHVYRLDMFRHLDGILDEFGDYPTKMVTSALLGIATPVLAWDHCGNSIETQKFAKTCAPDGATTMDAFFAQHLYLGVQPMGPFVNQSHGVLPSPAHLAAFSDWAELFRGIRGKQWVLTARAVEVVAGAGGTAVGIGGGAQTESSGGDKAAYAPASSAKANMFWVGRGKYVVAVVAFDNKPVTVAVAPLQGAGWASVKASALLPGAATAVALALTPLPDGGASLTTPLLSRGAALCVLEVQQ